MALKAPKLPPIETGEESTDMVKYSDKNQMSYSLIGEKGTNLVHVIPTEKGLKPNQDTQSGEVETWPAYASRSVSDTALMGRSFQKNPLMIVKKSVIPKPKFLSALETYVKKEIVQLGCSDPKPSELRLQAYREVFEYLIEDFKTYKPLLSEIKNEYEKMLSSYRERIRELEPLKSMLITVSEQCDKKILKIREDERQEILTLRKSKMDLLRYIDSMKETERSLETQVAKLQEQLSVEYRKYRNECDMRKLLISDMNDLQHQQEDLKRAAGQGVIDEDDDPIRLKLSLKVAKEDLTRQAEELTRIKADYGDVVPRRDFEMLEAKMNALLEKQELSEGDFSELKSEHETLLDIHKQVLSQRDEFYTEAESLRRSATPRPEWNKCGDVLPGGVEHWEDVITGKTSEQILEALIKEFQSGGSSGPEYFDGKGLEEDVPKFLRYDGKVRNRKMTKAEVSSILKEIWFQKVQSDSAKGSRQKMTEYIFDFFQNKFNNMEDLVYEWGYSLHDALNNYQEKPHVEMLLDVINGDGTEDLYYHRMDIINKLATELNKIPKDAEGNITMGQFTSTFSKAYPLKSEQNIQALTDSACEELEIALNTDNFSNVTFDYQALFTEDEEGDTGPFLNLLRTQDDQEIETYIGEILNQLEGITEIPLGDLRSTMMMIDPSIAQEQMMKYLEISFKCDVNELDDAKPVEVEVLKKRMKKGGVCRVGAVY